MFDLAFRHRDRLILAGFKNLIGAPYVAVYDDWEMMTLWGAGKKKKSNVILYFNGITDPMFKKYLFDHFDRVGAEGSGFLQIEGNYYEMLELVDKEIDQSLFDGMQMPNDRPDDFSLLIL